MSPRLCTHPMSIATDVRVCTIQGIVLRAAMLRNAKDLAQQGEQRLPLQGTGTLDCSLHQKMYTSCNHFVKKLNRRVSSPIIPVIRKTVRNPIILFLAVDSPEVRIVATLPSV